MDIHFLWLANETKSWRWSNAAENVFFFDIFIWLNTCLYFLDKLFGRKSNVYSTFMFKLTSLSE
jgi:hypothetical protein